MAPDNYLVYLEEARAGLDLRFVGDPESFAALTEEELDLQSQQSSDVAYIQYTSGSTRFPRGVMITQQAVLSNLAGIIKYGVKMGCQY